ncbi:hypothetical protein [Streptomyces noursei]|uniref:hypothetical protein n=1 Tax=Streptomyces noursei TaxID=1971 RepID=UPI0023B7BF1A|nr:hypothetical protein [Streptomyces noursei]
MPEVPWVAITPVIRVLRVLRRMVPPGELLLSSAHHDIACPGRHPGSLKLAAVTMRLKDFVAWANREAETRDMTDQSIPDDPQGTIAPGRFRRTLAWDIARRPGGLIALAIQYGHMRTALDARTSAGYASRSRDGIHSVLDIETARPPAAP